MRGLLFLAILAAPSLARADDAAAKPSPSSESARPANGHEAAPIHGFTYSAKGSPAVSVGAVAYGQAVGDAYRFGGRVFGSPIDRLTLVADAERRFNGNFRPALAVIVRLFGGPEGVVIGALAKGKAEGFTTGKDVEGEAEAGLLLGYHRARFHFDTNALGGTAIGAEREIDAELKMRVGYDVLPHLRVGIDGQARFRLVGDRRLSGDRTWDFVVGPQVLAGYKSLYAAASAGPTTYNYGGPGVGFLASLAVGATTL